MCMLQFDHFYSVVKIDRNRFVKVFFGKKNRTKKCVLAQFVLVLNLAICSVRLIKNGLRGKVTLMWQQ